MGVPKFYRWISERYPNIGRTIPKNQLPEVDNFYLDMNGIIHNCSHFNDDHSLTKFNEAEIFENIFHYIDFLFRLIKPRKTFYMAIDGVAPRAKMNQQRARRFRSGQEQQELIKSTARKEKRSIEEVSENIFDSNAITPGTQFMEDLDRQLRYFIHTKVTSDPLWEGVQIYLSGHSTPGEGEHKIMDYIRYTRSQPGYDVNTRHCMYGLDADLIILALATHEMHFVLLREEVKYGSKKISKISMPENITWDLLYIEILRDCIDLEFRSLKNQLKFPYNLDSVIDDWILMGYLVGNDFVPHLPHIHIKEEALILLWNCYKKILPQVDGYLNEHGEINLARFEIYLSELAKFDHQRYADENDTFKNLGKLNRKHRSDLRKKSENISSKNNDFDFAVLESLDKSPTTLTKPISDDNLSECSDPSSESSPNDFDREENLLRERLLTSEPIDENDLDRLPLIEAEFRQHKNNYYREKMRIDLNSTEDLKPVVQHYIVALQWILKYYYQGCPSWSWFYPYHYAPYLSDLKNFKDLKIDLQQGSPFLPFEQLLSVLPPTSCRLLPAPLRPLMTDLDSPLLSFYPEDFIQDLNEKKNSWESVVILPFINEELLLNTIRKYYTKLEENDQLRNRHQGSVCFQWTTSLTPTEQSLRTNPHFPPLNETRARCTEIPIDAYQCTVEKLKFGRFDEKDLVYWPNFPILNALPYQYSYKSGAVSVFDSFSKTESLLLKLDYRPDPDCISYNEQWNSNEPNSSPLQIENIRELLQKYLGKQVFVDWPHFQSGIVCAMSDFRKLYVWSDFPGRLHFDPASWNNEELLDRQMLIQTPVYFAAEPFEINPKSSKIAKWFTYNLNESQTEREYKKALAINYQYERRRGISIGPIPVLLYVSPITGYRKKFTSSSSTSETMICSSNQSLPFPLQTTLLHIAKYQNLSICSNLSIQEYFKKNDQIFSLQIPFYGCMGTVEEVKSENGKVFLRCRIDRKDQPDLHQNHQEIFQYQMKYFSSEEVGKRLNIPSNTVARITGRLLFFSSKQRHNRTAPINVGLGWKWTRPTKELHGYTRKSEFGWLYSDAAIQIISDYMNKFPEVFTVLEKQPDNEFYFDTNIGSRKFAKVKLNEIRVWIKSLPTYSMEMIDSQSEILHSPTIAEIDRRVKLFYQRNSSTNDQQKKQSVCLSPEFVFKPDDSLGLCEPESNAKFYFLDRVVNVRHGTGIPLGTCGTIVGVLHDTFSMNSFYEVLFDELPETSSEKIFNNSKYKSRQIKVPSCHLLNFSHLVRLNSQQHQNYNRSFSHVQTSEQENKSYSDEKFRFSQRISKSLEPGSSPATNQNRIRTNDERNFSAPWSISGQDSLYDSSPSTPFFTEIRQNPTFARTTFDPVSNSARQFFNQRFYSSAEANRYPPSLMSLPISPSVQTDQLSSVPSEFSGIPVSPQVTGENLSIQNSSMNERLTTTSQRSPEETNMTPSKLNPLARDFVPMSSRTKSTIN